ncbi:AmmeMemoRadiSam system protein B [Rubrivirga sp. IMCC43871]|uniref:AmmeMemoRadiSam system protein B n=1 Tax=Rubrivirga sp. IMCC43871 TaxID=3391575 RepID=UPI0039902ED8
MSLASRAVYPSQPAPLRTQLDGLLADAPASDIPADAIVGLIVPDSNRTSGGPAAAAAYSLLAGATISTALVVSPSHHGAFGRLSICQTDAYQTPLGDVRVNDHLRNELCDEDDDIFLDDTGHYHTEGADVQLPFLQRVLGDAFDTVPIVMGDESPSYCFELGRAVGEIMYGQRAIVVGSCDVITGDADALDALRAAVEAMDAHAVLRLMADEAVQVEGIGAVATALIAAKERGATAARVLMLDAPGDGTPGTLAAVFWKG